MNLDRKLKNYYTGYYRDQLGLPDWGKRVEARLGEDETWGDLNVGRVEEWLSYDFSGKKVLVVGAGTGAEMCALAKRGAEVHGIEPDPDGFDILNERMETVDLHGGSVQCAVGEKMPFEDESFDFIYCFTVLEHVQDVEETVREMVRVARVNGWIFIVTPDYRQFYEPHYKLTLPMILPKWIIRICLRLQGRPAAFLDTLQLVNARKLAYFFQGLPVLSFQLFHPWPEPWKNNPSCREKWIMRMARWTGAQRDQWWFLKKMDGPRK